jgi:hypothetical protein
VHRVRLFSDDSYKGCGDGMFNISTAGIALVGDRSRLRDALLEAEDASGKGTRDWHETKEIVTRERYIEHVLRIQELRGRVFYGVRGAIELKRHSELRLDVIAAGIISLSQSGNHHDVAHEGLPSQGRYALRSALLERGIRRVTMEKGGMDKPEIRLVDALSGFVRAAAFPDPLGRDEMMGPIPDWFVRVAGDAEKENPLVLTGGGS